MAAALATSAAEVTEVSPLRPVLIWADLLPTEVVDARRTRKVRLLVISGLLVFAVVLGGWYAQANAETAIARVDVGDADADVQRLLRQQQVFAEVVDVQAESREIRSQLALLFAQDLPWSTMLGSLQSAAPKGVAITGAFGSVKAPNPGAPAAGPAAGLPSNSAAASIGTLTVTGSTDSKLRIAAYVDILAKLDGLANPQLGDVTLQEGGLQFTIRLDITDAIVGGRFTPARTKPAGARPKPAAPTTGPAGAK
jgi:Tfp pilus assembly protein PilN